MLRVPNPNGLNRFIINRLPTMTSMGSCCSRVRSKRRMRNKKKLADHKHRFEAFNPVSDLGVDDKHQVKSLWAHVNLEELALELNRHVVQERPRLLEYFRVYAENKSAASMSSDAGGRSDFSFDLTEASCGITAHEPRSSQWADEEVNG